MSKWRLLNYALAALAVCTVLTHALPSQAQEPGATVWARGGCAACHGNLAAGDGDPSYPRGPNLRRTQMDRDQLIETIACGRPNTQMPTNLRGAYKEVACFGLPLGDVPGEVVGLGKGSLSSEEITTLVDFLVKNVVGKPRITRANCALFNEGNQNAPECMQF